MRRVALRPAHVLLEIAEDPKAHNRDRVAATRELLDRGWGKAPAYASVQMDDPLELSDIAREIQTIADELGSQARSQALTPRQVLLAGAAQPARVRWAATRPRSPT